MRLPFASWAVFAICGVALAGAPPEGQPAATSAEAPADTGNVVKEQIVPGSEPRSPSTIGFSIQDLRNLRQTPGATGTIGTLHVLSADLGGKGVLRFSAIGEYSNQRDFPVVGATNSRSAGTFGLSYVLVDWLELYASYSASANTNSTSTPHLISSLGDFGGGAKFATRLAGALYAGVDLRVMSYASVGSQNLRGSAVGFAPQLITTYDLRQALPGLPVRLHGNFGALLDNTKTAVANAALNASEQYALSINAYQRLTLGVAAEAPLPWVTPFVEYNVRYPLRVPGGNLVGPDGVLVRVGRVMPQVISLGAKFTAIRDLTLIAAVDLGLSRLVGLGIPATAPYNILFGAAFNVDLLSRGETRIVEKTAPAAPAPQLPKYGRIAGVVLDARTKRPIAGAIVSVLGADLPPVASDEESGAFVSHELVPSRPVRLSVHKEGYRSSEQVVLLEEGKTSRVEVDLEMIAKKARFAVNVTSNSRPIMSNVSLKGPDDRQVPMSGASRQAVKVEATPGKYVVDVTAPGYLAQTREVVISDNADMELNFDLAPRPKRNLVMVRENRIETLRQIHFAPGKATILADSYPLLAEIVDSIVKAGIKLIRIEGHTDNHGDRKRNLQLSDQRAKAVATYLGRAGIDPGRLEAAGFGDSRPIAPNLTARGRELNRRVELIIVER
jgi:outer membrane protein OmpA-like peptidoglycan-associated protein